MLEEELDLVEARRKIIDFIKKEATESRTDGVVLALSGGIDSSVTAYLSVEALGARRVMGLIMPDLRVTPKQDLDDAKEVASELGMETRFIDIAPIHRTFMKNLEPDRLAEGNLRARIRMALLYYHSNRVNRLVVGTGHRSELLAGYFTKGGDGGVDILPIGDLYKTEVRRLGETLGLSRWLLLRRARLGLQTVLRPKARDGECFLKVESRLGRGSEVNLKVSRVCPQEAATTHLQASLRMLIHGKQSSWNLPGR